MSTPRRRSARTASPAPKPPSARSARASPAMPSIRPPIPIDKFNIWIDNKKDANGKKCHSVKIQELQLPALGGDETARETLVIARVKVPVPENCTGHIIKRFDTDSVSVTSLFKSAFPTSTDSDYDTEMEWITKGSGGMYGDWERCNWLDGPDNRILSGYWIPTEKAYLLAEEYSMSKYVKDLFDFPAPEDKEVPSNFSSPVKPARAPKVQTPDARPSPRRSARSPPVSQQKNVSSLVSAFEIPVSNKPRTPVAKRAKVAAKPPSTGGKTASKPGSTASFVESNGVQETPAKNSVKVVQSITRDPKTGIEKETTEVSVQIPKKDEDDGEKEHKLIGTEEEITAQIEAAKDIVENLKVQGILKEVGYVEEEASANKKRGLDPEFDEQLQEEPVEQKPGFLSRLWKKRSDDKKRERGLRVAEEVGTELVVVEPTEGLTTSGRLKLATFGLVAGMVAVGVAPYFLG